MLTIGGSRVRVYVCREATDMRCSFRGLSGKVRSVLKEDPLSGHLFCFMNRRKNYVKLLYWDRSGYCIWSKKLTRGTFYLPSMTEITIDNLSQILSGHKPKNNKQHLDFMR